MDAPRHHFRAFAGIQLPAGVHAGVQVREGLADQSSFARIVQNEAETAQDQSKLAHDFGASAESPRTTKVLAEIQETVGSQTATVHRNPLVDAAAMYSTQDVAVAPRNWKPLAKQPQGNPYTHWIN